MTLGILLFEKAGQEHAMSNADGISHLPLPEWLSLSGDVIMLIERLQSYPSECQADQKMDRPRPTSYSSEFGNLFFKGGPQNQMKSSNPIYKGRESSAPRWLHLMGCHMVIPSAGRQIVKEMLHEGHSGIVRMKSKAQSTVWWPMMDNDLEKRWRSAPNVRSS